MHCLTHLPRSRRMPDQIQQSRRAPGGQRRGRRRQTHGAASPWVVSIYNSMGGPVTGDCSCWQNVERPTLEERKTDAVFSTEVPGRRSQEAPVRLTSATCACGQCASSPHYVVGARYIHGRDGSCMRRVECLLCNATACRACGTGHSTLHNLSLIHI